MGFERISSMVQCGEAGTMIDSVPSHSWPGLLIFRSGCTTSAQHLPLQEEGGAVDEQTRCMQSSLRSTCF